MLKNYLRTAIRNLRRHRATTLINVGGLAVGLAACVLIGLFIGHERSFDRFHADADRIYRMVKTESMPGQRPEMTAVLPGNVAPALEADFPEIEEAVRVTTFRGGTVVRRGTTTAEIEHVAVADAAFFEVFSFDVVRGDPSAVLAKPLSIVLTEETATRLFGDADPVGQTLDATLVGLDIPLTVTGVARSAPTTSHLQFGAVVSWATTTTPAYAGGFSWMNRWISNSVPTYLLLEDGTAPAALEAKLPAFLERHIPTRADQHVYGLQPLTDVHLGSSGIQYGFNWQPGSLAQVYVFGVAAVLILLIACANFVNLTTARASVRAREVGVRKAVGAHRGQLVGQFLGEAVLLAVLAGGAALALATTVLPFFADAVGRPLSLGTVGALPLTAGVLGLTLAVGLVAGFYPAVVLSRFRPAAVLKRAGSGGSSSRLRAALVVGQFAVAVVLLAGTAVVLDQVRYLRTHDLGFDQEQVFAIPLRDSAVRGSYETFKAELLAHPGVVSAAGSDDRPGGGINTYTLRRPGAEEEWRFPMIGVEPGFEATYGFDVVAGRTLRDDLASDSAAVVVNETLALRLAETPEAAVGQTVLRDDETLTVVGVVADFHTSSLHEEIGSLLLYRRPGRFRTMSVRVRPDAVGEVLAHAEQQWEALEAERAFEYTFLDDAFGELHEAEQRLTSVLALFAALAALIACLGLFGLATFAVERRTKEVGIRKVLGATVGGLAVLLSRDLLALVGVACVVAAPVAYLAAQQWLATFAYHVELSPAVFVAAGSVAVLIALATVSGQAVRAARKNPTEALRYE